MKVTKENFHLKTKATFDFIKFGSSAEDLFDELANEHGLFFSSGSGSQYVIADNIVYRLSDHWGRVASCKWGLKGCPGFYGKKEVLASCKLSDFEDMKKPVEYILFTAKNSNTGRTSQYGIEKEKYTQEFMSVFTDVNNFRSEINFE